MSWKDTDKVVNVVSNYVAKWAFVFEIALNAPIIFQETFNSDKLYI